MVNYAYNVENKAYQISFSIRKYVDAPQRKISWDIIQLLSDVIERDVYL